MDALLEAVHASAPAAAGVPSTADGSQAAPPAAAPAAAGKRRGAGAQPASKRASKPARGERGGGKAGGSSRRPARPPTREQLLAQLVTRLRNASRRKRKDTAWRRSPAFELLQEQKAQEAKRKAELEQAAAAAVAQQQPLIKPPSWWHALWADSPARREQSSLRVDLSDQGDDNPLVSAVEARSSHDGSVFQLRLEPRSMTHLDLHWCFPPANPGSSGAWIGLFAAHEGVHEPRARLRFKLLTRDAVCGTLKWTSKQFAGLPDGEYVFALMADYGVESRALSQRFWLLDSRCVMLDGEPGAVALSESLGPRGRNSRFALTTRKAGADDEEALDERCYFPVPLVDVVLGREAEAAPPPPSGALAAEAAASEPAPAPAAGTGTYSSRVKRAYQLTDKHSYLDWGLSSDYDRSALADERRVAAAGRAGGAGGAAAAAAAEGGVYVPAQLARVMRKPAKQTGLGGGTRGSEGYGEATIGSVQKLLVVLQHLRHLVLTRLYSDAPWWAQRLRAAARRPLGCTALAPPRCALAARSLRAGGRAVRVTTPPPRAPRAGTRCTTSRPSPPSSTSARGTARWWCTPSSRHTPSAASGSSASRLGTRSRARCSARCARTSRARRSRWPPPSTATPPSRLLSVPATRTAAPSPRRPPPPLALRPRWRPARAAAGPRPRMARRRPAPS